MAKAPVHGASIKRPIININFFDRNIMEERFFIQSRQPNDPAALSIYNQTVTDAVSLYIGSHKGSPLITKTIRNRQIAKLLTAAKKIHESIISTQNLETSYIDYFNTYNSLTLHAKSTVHKYFSMRFLDYYDLHLAIESSLDTSLNDKQLNLLKVLMEINVDKIDGGRIPFNEIDLEKVDVSKLSLKEKSGKYFQYDSVPSYHDAYLFNLITSTMDAWKNTTGRTIHITRAAKDDGEGKFHPFAEWLILCVRSAGGRPPTAKAIRTHTEKLSL